jgi:hypothetical protein
MASKPSTDAPEDPHAIPSSVIAQAEAAIVGNFEDETPPIEKRKSRAQQKQDYLLHQTKSRGEGTSK